MMRPPSRFALRRTSIESRSREYGPGLVIAAIAGVKQASLIGSAGNDDYQHLTYARQLLAGDLPLRDFWDISTTLQEAVSAVSQVLFGYRLLSEAILVGLATAVAVFLVFRLVRTLTESSWIAVVCASLFIVAVPRAYAYPKWLVYAVAASLWWSYVWWPSTRKAILAGASVAVAFYWRHDHGVLTAMGVALSMAAAHGWTRDMVRRTTIAGAVALAGVLPYLVFAAVTVGPISFIQLDLATFTGEHVRTHGELRWPLRSVADYIGMKPAEWYAPEIIIRWKADVTADARAAALEKYGLTPTANEGQNLERVRLSARSLDLLRALVDDPQIEDTSRLERGSATFSREYWPLVDRALFKYPWLRVRLLPGIDRPYDAALAAALLMHAVPLLATLLVVSPVNRGLPPAMTPRTLLLFVLFAVIVNVALVREPYSLRSTEVLVLPAILIAVSLATVLQLRASLSRWPARLLGVAVVVLAMKSLAVASEFPARVRSLTGAGPASIAEEWRQLAVNLTASPPSRLRGGEAELATARLADYVRRCVAPADRILVLWYAPEIYYESDRLMAGRHLYFFSTLANLETEQQLELEKVARFKPPIVLTNSADTSAARAFPAFARQIERDYAAGAVLEDEGARYSILFRRDTLTQKVDTITGWPCYS